MVIMKYWNTGNGFALWRYEEFSSLEKALKFKKALVDYCGVNPEKVYVFNGSYCDEEQVERNEFRH